MPYLEPIILEGRNYSLRHIGPQSALWPGGIPVAVTPEAVLNQANMVGREMPIADIPNSPDFAFGAWTGRLNDAGEMTLTFPNKEATDGTPWRDRFDPTLKNQWVEIRNDGYVEAVCCIEKVDKKRDQIVISGHDGFWQTKHAYARDWITVQAPRDVIERGTMFWVNAISDDFSYEGTSALPSPWTSFPSGGSTAVLGNSGGVNITVPVSGQMSISPQSAPPAVTVPTNFWSAVANFSAVNLAEATGSPIGTLGNALQLSVQESSGDIYTVGIALLAGGAWTVSWTSSVGFGSSVISSPTSVSLMIESDGEQVWFFANGQLVGATGGQQRLHTNTTLLFPTVTVRALATSTTTSTVTWDSILVEALQPGLMRGADKGDYALPSITGFAVGAVATYPTGGLHARYFNNADLASDTGRLVKLHHKSRTAAFVGSTGGPGEYANQLDPQINGQANAAGAAASLWSCMWFGAIYLKLSAGDYALQIFAPAFSVSTAVRVWIGKTKFGDQLVDQWTFANGWTYNFTVSAAALAGTLPYGGGTVQRDGWYPIRIEYAVDGTAEAAPTFRILTSPAAYTDPGGTAIAAGSQTTVVPSTSLSPLGCVDQRHQGVSHFDLIQKTAQAFGYQTACEPQSLESQLFPGVLAPRFVEGQEFDAVLEPDDHPRAEALLNYSNSLDATDSCTSLFGNGAGFQNGNTGQLQGYVFDHTSLQNALFNVQAWQDFSDASFASLLQALLTSQLGLRLQPWQVIAGDPVARERLAYPWPLPVPLTATLAQMRWRPGDALRVYARDIGVQDTVPRQLLVITRQIHPNGTTGVQVSFAERPRTGSFVMRQLLFQASRWQRNYQRQLVSLAGTYVTGDIAPGAIGGQSRVALQTGDQVVHAWLRVTVNLGNVSFNVLVNGADQTASLQGPWSTVPLTLDLTPVAASDPATHSLYVTLKNNSGVTTSDIEYQLLVDVLR